MGKAFIREAKNSYWVRDLTHSEQDTEKSLSTLEQLEKLSLALPLPENISAETGSLAQNIWVLGSSLGGPEAIKEFLDSLPEGLPVWVLFTANILIQNLFPYWRKYSLVIQVLS